MVDCDLVIIAETPEKLSIIRNCLVILARHLESHAFLVFYQV